MAQKPDPFSVANTLPARGAVTVAATIDPEASPQPAPVDPAAATLDAVSPTPSLSPARASVSTPPPDPDDIAAIRGAKRYERGPVLGSGGMGEVRLNVDRRIGRRVAAKTLHEVIDSPSARQRFLREVRVQGQLEHPSVVPVYDLDVDDGGQLYFTMKRVRGDTLERVLERLREEDPAYTRRYGRRRLLSAFAQVCLAVHYAHSREVVHRDLKPANIMFGDFGEVYVLDWGLAKVVGEPDPAFALDVNVDDPAPSERAPLVGDSGPLTVGGVMLGTPAYMAPEQVPGKGRTIDARTDVFALGAILFEILTLGRLRPKGELSALLRLIASGEAARPSDRVEGVPPELDELCARALSAAPSHRPASAREVAEAVERFLDGEHDVRLRRELAEKHAAVARKLMEGAEPTEGDPRVAALRETMKALALDADDPSAQRLLVELLTEVPAEVPAEAKPELDAAVGRVRARGAKLGFQGLLSWCAAVPVVLLIGVRSWSTFLVTAAATLASAFYSRTMSRRATGFDQRQALVLAGLVALVVALTSCYLGPFTLVPTCGATASLLFAMASTRRERPLVTGIIALGVLAPFVAEMTGILPRAYTFEPGRVVVLARAIELPQWPTMGAMIYSSVSFTILAAVLVGGMRDALSASERRQFLQAWYLRQIFPAGAEKPDGG